MEVTRGEAGEVICTSAEFSSFVEFGEQPRLMFRISERLAKLRVAVGYEVFGVQMRGGGGGGCLVPFFPLPSGRWEGWALGLCWG